MDRQVKKKDRQTVWQTETPTERTKEKEKDRTKEKETEISKKRDRQNEKRGTEENIYVQKEKWHSERQKETGRKNNRSIKRWKKDRQTDTKAEKLTEWTSFLQHINRHIISQIHKYENKHTDKQTQH